MKIDEYTDLSDFISNEQIKMQENLGAKQSSAKMLHFTEESLIKYAKLYDKPIYRREARRIKLMEAIDTMPHGFIWRFFHPSLWYQVRNTLGIETRKEQRARLKLEKKLKEKNKKSESEDSPQMLYPERIKPMSPPAVGDDFD